MASDEIPPEWMWHLDQELAEWFEEVEFKRQQKYGGNGDDMNDEAAEMMTNELARKRR